MIKLIKDIPENVVGIEVTENVSKEEYDTTVVPKMDELANKEQEINYLIVVKTDISNFETGVWWDDFKMALKHFKKWHKIAIVSNREGIKKLTDIFGFAYPGNSKTFDLDEYQQALNWVAA
jgi:hypothetical protein